MIYALKQGDRTIVLVNIVWIGNRGRLLGRDKCYIITNLVIYGGANHLDNHLNLLAIPHPINPRGIFKGICPLKKGCSHYLATTLAYYFLLILLSKSSYLWYICSNL